uniref:Uncharacterized protein n=1 Tax=Rhizophora mucronata TaxID=61149 RepID=A0A2P2PCL4_RHIMU
MLLTVIPERNSYLVIKNNIQTL